MSTELHEPLTGWGRTNPTFADVVDLAAHELTGTIRKAGPRGALIRGLGRSYGDAAQNAGGMVVRLAAAAHEIELDVDAATARIPAGLSIDDLLRVIVPRGFFVPVTPGTRFVTIGGAIASDIHGKNHHVEGSFGNHLANISLLLADGTTEQVSQTVRPDLFWATVGGMGLTGIIVDATVRLLPIQTSRMSVDTSRIPDIDALFAAMTDGDDAFRYSVAWIDLMAKGQHLGRGVLTRGDHAAADQLDAKTAAAPLEYGPHQLIAVPPLQLPIGLINGATCSAFAEVWYRKAPKRRVGELQSIGTFFHPLDFVGRWNRLYGRRGMVQYQFVVPFGEQDAMRAVVERISVSGASSFLAVLKRFGAANEAPLSFPAPGWTLALDVPAGSRGLGELLHSLDRLVLDAGGRHYFAKDAHTTSATIARGYPRLDEWKRVRRSVDPNGLWQSDLSRRLGLTP